MLSRRSFVQAMAAAMGMTTLGFATKPVDRIDWRLFCDDLSSRYDLRTPWAHGDSMYATDGRCLLANLQSGGMYTDETRKVPSLDILPWDGFSEGGWRPSSVLSRVALEPWEDMMCPTCYGFGVIGPRKLCDCDGYCDRCDGIQYIGKTCQVCEGDGYLIDDTFRWTVDGHQFCPGLLARFQSIGDFDFRLEQEPQGECMLIRFDRNLVGMQMGMHKTAVAAKSP